jgi:hypothetical protein
MRNLAAQLRTFGERAYGGRLFALGAFAIGILTLALYAANWREFLHFPASHATTLHGDIDSFIRAGELVVAGDTARAYDHAYFASGLAESTKGIFWPYPPYAFLLFAPFGVAPFVIIRPIWVAASICVFLFAMRRASGKDHFSTMIAITSSALFMALYYLQSGVFTAAALAVGLAGARSRPILAGVALGILAIKPQYGLLAPFFLAVTGNWPAFFAAALTGLLMVALSLPAFGIDTWRAYFESLSGAPAAYYGIGIYGASSASQLALKLGATATLAGAAQLVVILSAIAASIVLARRADFQTAAGATLIFSLAAAPSAWTYDWAMLAIGLAIISRAHRVWPIYVQALALFAMAAPYLMLFRVSAIAAPLSLLALAIAVAHWLIGETKPAAGNLAS